ncbi:MAG: PEP-CTERM sorting domain-containing protein [Verrucomicrobiae bacterium]|nr:PEP-CTERM sorting domain-containing protein [Verrucomicrobiae bacterium]MDW7979566.1 PEP-CTERM sorting domain-containing protein [Verrucomicrobiales bacterium]
MKKHILLIGVPLALWATSAGAQLPIVYVDVIDGPNGNTETYTNGQWTVWNAFPGQTGTANDGIWDRRDFGNIPPSVYTTNTIYQNAASGHVDPYATPLRTTITVPEPGPGQYYNVYVFFWSDPSSWRVRASLTGLDQMTLFTYNPAAPTDQVIRFWPTPTWNPPAHSGDQGTHYSTELNPNPFTTSVMISQGNRVLLGGLLGQTTSSTITVYMAPDPNQADSNQRTWIDGIGYQLVPEPTTYALLGLGALAVLLRWRRVRS